ncbi:MdtP family multidrug efflux transporter outer membrane subunit [Paraburkholderia ferrariae]|uniref:MdtP family multidrug efflux transporter outer membrane subunit n=1 Tax=Paraburkholderia ferrariae TaxID=386056 RepID=UPI0005AB8F3A|nr:MdtP family multidrug efflux transporter outer membrane subunit [Paraburkholderia ferrariae]
MRRFVCRQLVPLALPFFAACAVIRHDSPPAAVIAPQQIRVAADIRLADEAWPSARWWEQYHDPQLDTLIELALAHAPTLAIAREHVSQAHAQVELVRAAAGLQMSALAEADREHVSAHGFLSAYASHDPAIGAYGPWYWTGLAGLGTHYDIDIWGKQRDLVRAALGEQNARRAEEAQTGLELSTGVARLYYGIQTTCASLDLLQQLREVRAFELDTRKARHERGLEALTQTETARSQLLAIDQQIASAGEQIVHAREALRALAGLGADDLPPIAPVPLPAPSAALPSTLSYELLARRPDLQAMRWLVQASLDRIDAAKAAFYPSFDISAFFGFNALRMRDLFMHSSQQINLIPGLTLPIFDGGRLNANLHGARTASNTLIEQYDQAVLDAVRDVAQEGSAIDDLDQRVQLQRQRIDALQFVSDSADASYRTGLADRANALQAEEPLLEGRLALVELSGGEIEAGIALTEALGGGYRNDDLPPALAEAPAARVR